MSTWRCLSIPKSRSWGESTKPFVVSLSNHNGDEHHDIKIHLNLPLPKEENRGVLIPAFIYNCHSD
jgi:hypothetical protein